MSKNWVEERHPILTSEINFWRNIEDAGFVSIHSTEPGSPAHNEGHPFMIELNTPRRLNGKYANSAKEARKIAKKFMEDYP